MSSSRATFIFALVLLLATSQCAEAVHVDSAGHALNAIDALKVPTKRNPSRTLVQSSGESNDQAIMHPGSVDTPTQDTPAVSRRRASRRYSCRSCVPCGTPKWSWRYWYYRRNIRTCTVRCRWVSRSDNCTGDPHCSCSR